MKDTLQTHVTLKARFIGLWKSNSSPHEIALGVALGVFIGITPFYGLHILMAFVAAIAIKRINKVAIFLGTSISLPVTIPFITWAGYGIGRRVLGGAYPSLSWDYFKQFSFENFAEFFLVLSVGSLILGLILSVVFYYSVLAIFKRRGVLRKTEAITAPA